jgi:hypothetical protein
MRSFIVCNSSADIILMIKLGRIREVGHVTLGETRMHIGFWLGNLWERDHMKDKGIDGRITI